MRFEDLDFHPSARKLRQFCLIGAVVLLAAGVFRSLSHRGGAVPLVAAAVILAIAGAVAPSTARLLWIAASVVTFPIGWLISRLLMGFLYFVVITAIGTILRLFRRSPHEDGIEPGRATYWTDVTLPDEPSRYFDQF